MTWFYVGIEIGLVFVRGVGIDLVFGVKAENELFFCEGTKVCLLFECGSKITWLWWAGLKGAPCIANP